MKPRSSVTLWTMLGCTAVGWAQNMPSKPNVVLIYADDLGYGDIACNGSETIRTPHLDVLASRGIRFTNSHSAAATSTPARYALLTGEYAWRKKGTGIAAGNAGMIIRPQVYTMADMFTDAGYATAAVGKWHLGLGDKTGTQDWNGLIQPNLSDIGFGYSYIMAATGDRTPCVYVENGRVVNLDPNDPIAVSYTDSFPGYPTGKNNPQLLKVHPSHGHDQAIVNGVSRIGYMKGGKSAWWKDETIADSITGKAVQFIERSGTHQPFFLYFATNDIHVPRVPNPRFVGKSGMGPRGDAILEFDWSVGQILETLKRLGIEENTIIIVSSDNGPVIDDGYKDQAVELLGNHKPWGEFRGGKYSLYEAGTRVPCLLSWKGVTPVAVSDALMCQIDWLSSFSSLLGVKLPSGAAPDSQNLLKAWLGKQKQGREYLVLQNVNNNLTITDGIWKYMEPGKGPFYGKETNTEYGNMPKPQLYHLKTDIGERNNVVEQHPEVVKKLDQKLQQIKDNRVGVLQLNAQQWAPTVWPTLKHYDQDHLYQVALPLGGIGTGTVSLGGRGELRDWEIMNVPAKKYSSVVTGNNAPFFSIYTRAVDAEPITTLLAGPLYDHEYLHYEGRPVNHHGLPRFAHASFGAAYPFGQVHLTDESLPIKVTIKGFNPLVPGDADASGMPVAVLSYEVTNVSNHPLEVSVCGSMRNFVGQDGSKYTHNWKGDFVPIGAKKNMNRYREEQGIKGLYFYSEEVDKNDPAWGTIALTTQEGGEVTYCTSSKRDDWSNALLGFWDDFSNDGLLTEKESSQENDPMGSLAVRKSIAPGAKETFTFFLTWNFPNRKAWSETVVGNYYSTQYPDAWDAAQKILPRIPALEKETLKFVHALVGSTYPEVVKEAALFNLATLRSQTVFRLPSGHLMGWEGVMDRFGSCAGSCTHVWNYEVATPFLFGELAQSMRDVELNYATRENGLMNFRAFLPLSEAAKRKDAAADGQMGCVMKAYREWQLSGDEEFLKKNWGQVKKVLSFAWIEKGWDGNRDGVMEGSQHNTMDVNYFGPNPQMGFWYMGALKAAEKMAVAMNDKKFAQQCQILFEKGSRWMDEHLFNGEYYEQKITDPKTFEYLNMDDPKVEVPDFQLGRGCLVDQLVGQYMAHLCGLGYLGDKDHIQTTLRSIMKYNFKSSFNRHFNNMRSYTMGDEAGLLMASWPNGRLEVPFPYFAETMTGFEYSTAVGMLYEGMMDEGLTCIRAIRDRHDGAKRNPFSEAECGHHYARSMASWAAVIAMSGFQYSGIDQKMCITSSPGTYFWSNGYAWGTCTVTDTTVEIELLKGSLQLKKLQVGADKEIRLHKFSMSEGAIETIKR